MRYLTSALISEGPTDDKFLPRILNRMLVDLCVNEFSDQVEIADVKILRKRGGPSGIEEILKLVDDNQRAFVLIFIHHDQGASPSRTESHWLEPIRAAWGGRTEQLVFVVPIRETEAWILADGDAIRRSLGVRWSNEIIGIPSRASAVEKIPDPKKVLARLEPRIGRSMVNYFDRLGELVSLSKLSELTAYRNLREQTKQALGAVGFR